MENKNNQSLNINKIDELKKLKILNSTLIKELRKYIDKNAKLQQEKELLYGKIEKLEKENKTLKGDFSSVENQNPHEETLDIVENVLHSNLEIKEEPIDCNDLNEQSMENVLHSNHEIKEEPLDYNDLKTFSLEDKISTKPYTNNESNNQSMEMTDNQSQQLAKFKFESYSSESCGKSSHLLIWA